MKKKLRLLLCIIMCITLLPLQVFATEEDATEPPANIEEEPDSSTEGEDPPPKEHEYELYQIFTGTYHKGDDDVYTLQDVLWGQNATYTGAVVGESVPADVLKSLNKISSSTSNATKLDEIMKYISFSDTNVPIKTFTGTHVEGLKSGYYLVRDKEMRSDGTYMTFTVKVVKDVLDFTPKVGVPEVTKKITETGKQDGRYFVGQPIGYTIESTLPDNYADFKGYVYNFTDTMVEGLTYNNDLVIKHGDVDVTSAFTVTTTSVTNGKFSLKATCADLKKGVPSADKDSKFTLTYSATLNEKAIIGDLGNLNEIVLTFSNDPNTSFDTSTSDTVVGEFQKVTVYTTQLAIRKVDEYNNPLQGVKFALYGDTENKKVLLGNSTFTEAAEGQQATHYELVNGSFTTIAPTTDTEEQYKSTTPTHVLSPADASLTDFEIDTTTYDTPAYKIEGTTDENGYLVFTGLGIGDYWLHEVETPAGYNSIADIDVNIAWVEDETKGPHFEFTKGAQTIEINGTGEANIVNVKGKVLPETGGSGVYAFWIAGACLVVLSLTIFLIQRKRASK